MIVNGISILLACAASVLSSPLGSTYRVKEYHPVPRGWTEVGPAPGSHSIELKIALKQHRFHELEKALYEVSDPEHARYGQHLTAAEVHELVRPKDEAVDLVEEWLSQHGVDLLDCEYTPARDWITVTIPVETVERLLNTKYSTYRHEEHGTEVVRTPVWSLPDHLHEHIVSVQPTNSFFRAAPQRILAQRVETFPISELAASKDPVSRPTVAQVCNTSLVTPLCLRTLYGTVNYVPQAAGLNRVGLNNFLNETNNRSDVNLFLQQFRPDAAGFNFVQEIIANGDNQQTPDTPAQINAGKDLEGNLDAETIIGITFPTPLFTFNTGGSPPFIPSVNTPTNTNEPYSTWVNFVLAQSDDMIPQVISTSYADEEWSVPLSFATTVCQQFAQLGARGVTLLFASGDSGVGTTGSCFPNANDNKNRFDPLFPSSCPFVTTVGATKNFNPEVVALDTNGFVSGGGFSNYFARPSYQNQAVTAYTRALNGQFAGLFNTTGRAYPDLAAQGQRFATVWDGQIAVLDGTSASTPAMASVISLVNDARLAAGKSPLGFLNPFLYSTANKAFNDITSGSAVGCGTNGFPALKGWDAVTGWGTPNFPQLKTIALSKR